MRVLLSTYGSRGDVEPMVGLAARLRALGAELLPRRAAGLVAAPFDTAAAVTEGCAGGGRHDTGGSAAMIGPAVVTAGGGSTGLMLADELALASLDVAIVERRGLHLRTIEVLDEQAPAYAYDVARAAQRRPALLTILTGRRRRVAAQATFLTDLAAQDHRDRWRSPKNSARRAFLRG